MEFEVGSLANLISGNKLVSNSKKKKLFQIIPSEKKIVKFKSVKKLKKSEWEVEEVKNTSSGEVNETSLHVDTNKEMKKRRKKKSKHNENENEMESKSSNALCAKKRLKYKKKKEMETNNESRKECEVFVGNVPHDVTKKKLANLFKQYGKVDTVRLRCAPLSDPRIPKKVAVITKKFHPDRNSMHAFVRFTKPECAKQAVQANGIIFEDHHLRVDLISSETHHDLKKAVFLGNVPFAAEEEDLWKIFEMCGTISSIRVIRDKYTGVGKGFAYINFENADAVELALKLDGTELNKRQLRVKRCIKKPPKVEVKKKKSRKVKIQNMSVSEHKPMKRNENWDEGINSDEQKIKKMDMFNKDQSSDRNKKYINDKIKENTVNKKFLKLKIKDGNENEKHKLGSLGSEKPKKSFSFKTSFQGHKTAEDNKKFKKKKKEKMNKAEVKKMSMIRKISSKSKPSLKKIKKPALKIKSVAKKMKLKPSSK